MTLRDGPAEAPSRRWCFGPAVLDESRLELRVRGEVVDVEPKSLEVLLYLLHHADEVVTKDELFDAVWPGRVLTESAVTRTVGRLREALGDGDQQLIKTVHGYGWRLIAPVAVEAVAGRALPRFDFKPGESAHLRPEWRLVECLGRGGHGEVWLARNDVTQERRVFKYAYDVAALTSLKREITLNRLLREGLGEHAACVRILRWNLEEPPCFIEAEYVAGGSLETWAARKGGLSKVDFATRLDLAAQIAEAVAAAHSMGVLHKDLKPENVLLEGDDSARIRLADFGSGGVLDLERMRSMGITRLGFTKSVAHAGTGTPLYLPPEVLAGQPATIQGDVFALGVMLYQLVIGDLKKPLAPGWEHDVDDELLREDIADAASGNPAKRLSDAAQLAGRLRTLEARRARRADERAARAEAERKQAEVERALARRGWVRATIVSLAAGLVVSVALSAYAFRARRDALASAATTEAVSAFLNDDLLAEANPQRGPGKDPTIKDALDRAAAKVDERFRDQPEARARLHATLAQAYFALSDFPSASRESEKAVTAYDGIRQAGTEQALRARSLQATAIYFHSSSVARSLAILDEALAVGVPSLGRTHPQVLEIAGSHAVYQLMSPTFGRAADEMRAVVRDAERAQVPDARMGLLRYQLGVILLNLSNLAEAERELRQAIRLLGPTPRDTLGPRQWLAMTLQEGGRLDEAERALEDLGLEVEREPEDSVVRAYHAWTLGLLRMDQERLDLADRHLQDAKRLFDAVSGPDALEAVARHFVYGELRRRQRRLPEAERHMRTFLAAIEKSAGPQNYMTISARAGLADVLREQGRYEEAWEVVRASDTRAELRLDPPTVNYALLRRVEGLLWLHAGNPSKARDALAEAVRIRDAWYPPGHALSQQWRQELAGVPPT